ncbi:site-specific DNA-methyltransferase, partial [Ileibacterium valens]|uniref:site-specific DNA-methyltransferase n=1 Tax=Ileibacterium valens TaxID=1862668 RepID=UPI003F7322C8
MDKLKMESIDLVEKSIQKLGELFPNVITETKCDNGKLKKAINFDILREMLSDEIVEHRETYEFSWPGKRKSLKECRKPIRKTLRPVLTESKKWDNTENIYIKGDNLDALKLLQESYLGKIDIVYIDPPYNTGNDLIYNDSFKHAQVIEDVNSGILDENGIKLTKNSSSNGKFHSDWCSMIFPRLLLARDLLSSKGVIFISIDDNEYSNMKNICDEVFGSQNYVATYIKQSKVGGGSDSKFIVKEHEYCLVYAKDISMTSEMYIAHDEDYLKRYKEVDENGRFFWDTFARPGLKNPIYYDIEAPDGSLIHNGWIHSKQRFLQEKNDGTIRFVKKNDGKWSVQFKQYLNQNGKKPRSMTMDFGGSIDGKNELNELFGNPKIFSYPKSTKFIGSLIETIKNPNAIVMDFFSGSATTADAVMRVNCKDSGNRKFILIQLQEECDLNSEASKEGYSNLCQIGEARIHKSGERLRTQGFTCLDDGFRVFEVSSSNMKDIYYSPDNYQQDLLSMSESNIKEDRTDLDLLFGCLLDWGLELSKPYKSEEI